MSEEKLFSRVLVTNDDGHDAPGLAVLEGIARELADEVWVVAPASDRTGASHGITLHRPLRPKALADRRFSLDGEPADCVMVALNHFMADAGPPDVVLSGVNRGANLAEDTHCSGTVGAAMEAIVAGIPAFALSQRLEPRGVGPEDYAAAAATGADAIRAVWKAGLPKDVLANINFPACAPEAVRGVKAAPIGRRKQGDHVVERLDPVGRGYFWIGEMRLGDAAAGSDVALTAENWISVSPLRLNWTCDGSLEKWQAAFD